MSGTSAPAWGWAKRPMIRASARVTSLPRTDDRRVRFRRRKGDDHGFALAWAALMLIVLFGFAGFGVDTANLWFRTQSMQRAADAGALAGAVFLPGDLPQAIATAKATTTKNGYTDGVNGVAVIVTQEPNPNRLRVRITLTEKTYFARLLGVTNVDLGRAAVGEYEGPVAMGSPTNNLGNQPSWPGEPIWSAGTGLNAEQVRANTDPQMWSQIAGPDTDKANGDRFTGGYCASAYYQCSGSTNVETQAVGPDHPNSDGYFYVVRVNVGPSDVTKNLSIQAYDPAFVQQGDTCTQFSSSSGDESAFESQLSSLATSQTEPTWNPTDKQYCPGDHFIRGGYETNNPTTSFQVRQPDQTPWSDTDNPIVSTNNCRETNTDPAGNAIGTFAPISGAPSTDANSLAKLLPTSNTSSQARYARAVFHEWTTVCNVPFAKLGITTAGEYDVVLGVRTEGGAGHNRYAMRGAIVTGNKNKSPDGSKVSIFANGKLPMYMNASGADTRFYLARLFPGNAGRVLQLNFWDVGDAAAAGQIQILPPSEATVNGSAFSTFNGCGFTRFNSAMNQGDVNAGNCSISNVNSSNGYNANLVVATIPVPEGYTCNSTDPFGCWVKVKFTYPTGTSVTDTTTWSANILGDPVRLVM